MQSRGARNPGRSALACLAVAMGSAIMIWTGVRDMGALGHETGSTAFRVGGGLFLFILSVIFSLNFLWGYRIVENLRSGRTRFGGWTITPADYDRFRAIDSNFAKRGEINDYRPLKAMPADGIEVVFSRDGVLIGDRYFGLASTGLNHFDKAAIIRSDPPMLEFGMVTTTATNFSVLRFFRIHSVLRVPVAPDAAIQAEKVADHFRAVLRGEVIVHPDFWKRRIRFGLVGAAVCAALAGVGFLLAERNDELGNIPLFLAVAGTIFAIGGLILALKSWTFERSRSRR